MTANTMGYQWTRAKDGAIFGVCKGLAQVFGIETWILRVIWLVAVLWFGTGLLLYFILALSLPREDKLDHALDGRILGVCARIAQRYRIEVGLVRTGFLVLLVITFGVAIVGYGLCYFLIPTAENS